jgi:uncharacterized Fe-S cluster protein YjdI
MARKAYRSEKITVLFDLQRCIHAIECTWHLPEVCDTEKRPWTQPGNAQPDASTTVARSSGLDRRYYEVPQHCRERIRTPCLR